MRKLLVACLAGAMAIGCAWAGVPAAPEASAEGGTSQEKVLDDFKDAENLFVDTVGLLDTYSVDSVTQRPFPSDWGLKFTALDGYYARVNNDKTESTTSGSHTVSYLPTKKDVSEVTSYAVSAEIEIGARADWGGLGVAFGETEAGAPMGVWYGVDAKTLYLAHSDNEFAGTFGEAEAVSLAVGDTLKLAVVVDGHKVSVYVDGTKVGDTVSLDEKLNFTPALGAEVKQYFHKYKNFSFRTLATALPAASYTITCISGAVEIGTMEYTYGTAKTLDPIARKGYKFMGWHLLPALNDEVVTSIGAQYGGDLTLYCEYTMEKYSITYYDGENKLEDNAKLTYSFTFKDYVSLPAIEKEGYTFGGWYKSADFSGTAVTAIEMDTTGNQVFYAKYTPIGGGSDSASTGSEKTSEGKSGCKNSGCSSFMGMSAGLVSLLALGGAAIIVLSRKKS